MDQDKSAVEQFLGDIGQPKEDPFKSADPFATKEEVKPDEDNEEADDKPVPFHRDPKVLRFIEKEVGKRITQTKPSAEVHTARQDDTDEVTAVLERIIGNDTAEKVQAVKDFRKVLGNLEDKGAQRAFEKIQEQSQAQVERERQAKEELDESFESIEETYNVDLSSNTSHARKTRTEFVDYIRKIAPKNEEGEVSSFPDIPAAWEEFQERSKRIAPSNTQAKALASRGVARSTDASAAPKTTGRSWRDIDKLFGNLTS